MYINISTIVVLCSNAEIVFNPSHPHLLRRHRFHVMMVVKMWKAPFVSYAVF